MTTDQAGEATFRWFPDWESHGAYVDLLHPDWATAVDHNDWIVAEDGALVMPLKPRLPRKPMFGSVTSNAYAVGGLLVEIKSFQGEEGHSDHTYAFTDESGNFAADCMPGATYTVCVNDGQLQSQIIDFIPYERETGKSNPAQLTVAEGNLIEIHVTSGERRLPMQNQWVYVRETHQYDWIENGERASGQGARDYPVYTNDDGIAHARALPGAELRISVNAGDWRSDARNITVQQDGITRVSFHRAFDQARQVKGRLIAAPNVDAKLAGATIVYGSIGGETDERHELAADADGHFAFQTKAFQLGIFAYTADGKAAGMVKPDRLDGELELQLKPTEDLHGRLLGKNDEPLAFHPVRVIPRVKGKRDFNRSFATSFTAKKFETTTDEAGNYTLRQLPTEFDMRLQADPIDDSKYDANLDEFYLIAGQARPRMVSRLDRTSQPDRRSLSKRLEETIRAARLDHFRILVLRYHAAAKDFVNTRMLARETNLAVMDFLNVRIEEDSLVEAADQQFAKSRSWPQPESGRVFVCALDEDGTELGRIELAVGNSDTTAEAAAFIRRHAPPQADALAKWDTAFHRGQTHRSPRVGAHRSTLLRSVLPFIAMARRSPRTNRRGLRAAQDRQRAGTNMAWRWVIASPAIEITLAYPSTPSSMPTSSC